MFTISALVRFCNTFNSATHSNHNPVLYHQKTFLKQLKKTLTLLLISSYFYSLLQKYNNFIKNSFLLKFFLISISAAKDGGFRGILPCPWNHIPAVF
jgi:hypothetical protein